VSERSARTDRLLDLDIVVGESRAVSYPL
jgi:hypothetical protein